MISWYFRCKCSCWKTTLRFCWWRHSSERWRMCVTMLLRERASFLFLAGRRGLLRSGLVSLRLALSSRSSVNLSTKSFPDRVPPNSSDLCSFNVVPERLSVFRSLFKTLEFSKKRNSLSYWLRPVWNMLMCACVAVVRAMAACRRLDVWTWWRCVKSSNRTARVTSCSFWG